MRAGRLARAEGFVAFRPLGQDAITIQHFDPTTVICAMKYLLASTLAAVIAAASTAAKAETSGGSHWVCHRRRWIGTERS